MGLELRNITKQFKNGSSTRMILNGLNLKVHQGEAIAIMGRSGSGKSTLLHVIAGLLPANRGDIIFHHEKLNVKNYNRLAAYRKQHIGYVTQRFHLLDDRNVFENVALPLRHAAVSKHEIKGLVENALYQMGMHNDMKKSVTHLSGGECQRVALARAIVKKPSLLLADEPTGALDEETERSILDSFQRLVKEGTSLIIVTHDDIVAHSCRHIYQLKDGILL